MKRKKRKKKTADNYDRVIWKFTVPVEIYCSCGNLLFLWKFTVPVEIYCSCGNLLFLWKFTVPVVSICMHKSLAPKKHFFNEKNIDNRHYFIYC
jgi:hypothetical protein